MDTALQHYNYTTEQPYSDVSWLGVLVTLNKSFKDIQGQDGKQAEFYARYTDIMYSIRL